MTRKEKYWGAISHAIFDTDLTAIRLCLAVSEFIWAVMLMWAGDTFGRPTYTVMSHVMNEESWALLFLISAVAQISIVAQEDYHSHFARYFAGYNALLWGFVVISMLMSVYPPPAAISAEISMALFAAWIWVRPYILAEGYRRARNSI
jgi:hypothetical protein